MRCLLCQSQDAGDFHLTERRTYLNCSHCGLIFVHPRQFLSREEEKKRYDQHQNSPEDSAYRHFLDRLMQPLRRMLAPGARGLDFGSGPGPTLSLMFEEMGHPMEIYDIFYENNPEALKKRYDFITATEVLEHLHEPSRDLDLIWNCLEPRGILGVMTRLAPDAADFAAWHYKGDPTHVCFYSRPTFEWLARRWGAGISFHGPDVIILSKK